MVVFYCNEGGDVPFVDWLGNLPERARTQCTARLKLLEAQGHHLRRPAADYLRDGIYELRARAGRVQYRLLYFFHGRAAIVVTHGITKRGAAVAEVEVERALERRRAFEANPCLHTFLRTL